MRTLSRRGFSLTEIVVSLGATAMLAAVVLPVVVRAQNQANNDGDHVCQSNLKQIGLGIMQYVQDYDEKMPLLTYPNRKMSWRTIIQPYMKSTQLFACPINPKRYLDAWSESVPAPGFAIQHIKVSYGANANILKSGSHSIPFATIGEPASVIEVSDSMEGHAEIPFGSSVAEFRRGNVLFAGHYSGELMNCLFVDGHVKAYRPSATLGGRATWFNDKPSTAKQQAYRERLAATDQFYTSRPGKGTSDSPQSAVTPTPSPLPTANNGGLQITDIKAGTGTEAKAGDTVTVHYRGTLTNGKQFDASYDRGEPFVFHLGAGQVIKGWDMGVVGMKVGGKRRLVIPPTLGYGAEGAGGVIPPNATLIFEIELLKVE